MILKAPFNSFAPILYMSPVFVTLAPLAFKSLRVLLTNESSTSELIRYVTFISFAESEYDTASSKSPPDESVFLNVAFLGTFNLKWPSKSWSTSSTAAETPPITRPSVAKTINIANIFFILYLL